MKEMQVEVESKQAGDPEQIELERASAAYVGRWNQLVSTTNWEKGRIIVEWREALAATQTAAVEYSDEAWSRRVGSVTGQHAGRLRRVYQRFGEVYAQYTGLFWSHFQAAIDWDDAEMWLEGAVQSRWSVSRMRRQRWETRGAVTEETPHDDEIISNELDEDCEPALDAGQDDQVITGDYAEVQAPLGEGPDLGDADPAEHKPDTADGASIYSDDDQRETVRFVRPFEHLAELPEDLSEAFEAFKLAILRHKANSWQEIPLDDVLSSLDALKELVVAPSLDNSPF